jgi:hypothetical protein
VSTVCFAQKRQAGQLVCSVTKLVVDAKGKQKNILLSKIYYNDLGLVVKEQNFIVGAASKEALFYYRDTVLFRSEFLDFDGNRSVINFLYDDHKLRTQIEEPEKGFVIQKEFDYNSAGNLISQTTSEFNKGDLENQSKELIFYDLAGKKIREVFMNKKDTVRTSFFTYDASSKLISQKDFIKHNRFDNEVRYEYDERGNLIKKLLFDTEDSYNTEEYTYDDKNRLTSWVVKSVSGDVINKEARYYDGSGLIKLVRQDLKFNKKEIEYYEKNRLKKQESWEDEKLLKNLVYTYSFLPAGQNK